MTGCHARRKMSGYLLFALGTSLVYTIGGIRGKLESHEMQFAQADLPLLEAWRLAIRKWLNE
jgi:hypothetical protein